MKTECTNENIGRLIAFYELGQLDNEDRLRFEAHLMDCPHCLKEVREMTPVIRAMREQKAGILKGLAQEGISFASQKQALLDAAALRSRKSSIQVMLEKFQRWLDLLLKPRILAPVAVAAALVLILLRPWESHNPYLAYLDHTKPPFTAFRGPKALQDKSARQLFKEGIDGYNRDDFRAAATRLEKAVEIEPQAAEYWLYLGISRYLDSQSETAIEALTRALASDDEILRATAVWYLAQSYLAVNNPDKARPLLQSLAQQGGEYAPRADSLLRKINSIK